MKKKTLEEIYNSIFHQKYSFYDFQTFDIENEIKIISINNKEIHSVSKKLKNIQRFLNSAIFNYAKINEDVVFSYRKNKTILNAVENHAHNNYYFQTDINEFFKSINKEILLDFLCNNLNDTPILDIKEYYSRIYDLVSINGSLPIGFSTSPAISNSCLVYFDNLFQEYCADNELVYSRYSDDIIVSSKYKGNIERIDLVIEKILSSSYGSSFSLNKNKTKYKKKGEKIKFLGMVIMPNGHVTVDKKIKNKIEVLLHYFINDKDKFLDVAGVEYDSAVARLSGQLNYINMVDSEYLNKIRRKYGNSIVDMFFHKTVRKIDF